MDIEALNKMIVGRWFASLRGDRCDLAIVDELATPDVLLQYSTRNPRCGQQAVKAFMAGFREAFPDLGGFRGRGASVASPVVVEFRGRVPV
jgi:hypothetical protein